MTFRWVTLGLALAAFIALPFTAVKAQTPLDPELYFYPASGWSVQNAAGNGAGCSILTEFNNGFRLQFTGSAGRIDTIALDFRQDIFATGDQYDALLVVPGIAQERAAAIATDPRMIAANIGNGVRLFEALRGASVLDFHMAENRFRFYLTAFDSAIRSFESCAESGNSGNISVPATLQAMAPARAHNEDDPIAEIIEAAKRSVARQAAREARMPLDFIPAEEPAVESAAEAPAIEAPAQIAISETRTPDPTPAPAPTPAPTTTQEPVTLTGTPPPPFWEEEQKTAGPAQGQLANEEFPEEIKGQRFSELLAQQMNDMSLQLSRAPLKNQPAERASQPTVSQAEPSVAKRVEPVREEISWNEVEEEIDASTAVTSDAHTPLILEEAPAPKAVIRQNISSPKSETTRQSGHMEADFTNAYARDEKPESRVSKEEIRAQMKAETAPKTRNEAALRSEIEAQITQKPNQKSQAHEQAHKNDLIRELMQKISMLEKDITGLQKENKNLGDELSAGMMTQREDRVSIASNNWDLERATMRFNEAERQLKRLGRELQKERARCEAEKEDLEAMLFDPQLTSQNQIARLADLEEQLSEAQADLAIQRMHYEERIRLLERQLGGE